MLYLRTGANGTCKTLFTLKDVREKQLKEGRPVCWNGRFKLKPEVEKEFGWKRIEFKDWQDQQDGTIFLIDECHNDLPKRPNGAMVPPHIAKLAEHRARGFDFFLITQHPGNIDTFVTKLVGAPGWHQHLKRIAGGSKLTSILQWDAVNQACEKNGSARLAQVTTRSQPKDVYDWYDSAELHTEKLRIPKTWLVVAAAVVLVPVVAITGFRMMYRHTAGPAGADAPSVVPAIVPGGGSVRDLGAPRPVEARPVMTAAEYVDQAAPRIAGLPHTAPRYDELTRAAVVPYPAACIEMPSKGCKCYTQRGTLIPAVDLSMCRQIISTGFFLDFNADPQGVANPSGAVVSPETVRWETNGDPRASVGGQPIRDHVPGDVLTAADIARLSRATTGSNPWARPAGVSPSAPAVPPDLGRTTVAAPGSPARPPG